MAVTCKSIIAMMCLILLINLTSQFTPKFPTPRNVAHIPENEQVQYQTFYFDQKVSHFNFKHADKTFKQKYLIDNTYWNKDARGPILMYCGNEGPI